MKGYSIYLPSYTIGEGVYESIGSICTPYGKTAVVIGGHRAVESARKAISEGAESGKIEILDFVWFGGECSYENLELLKANETVQKADMIFAVGGGKATDTARLSQRRPKSRSSHFRQLLLTVPHARAFRSCIMRMEVS